ncbi:MAG: UBA/THIF-type NAD/FAD binding protein [Candidatus Roizmanbacteria bacterium GW2011_GWA2_37_7]|uniref:UBA/THIF-type NAD/FAD binding protein n=1 Tax=Candidatus Roizmanbacteria bacterium GW2011_GWA2_37_7 TaxID=1618481 RepID=A0A0G0JLX6_9BACT|nr:MAG: UBA/THIF-type NAD/FAD binding protein [Candidatus Roizmanbacteria bacterium GW2011_GWA2_37_7]
MLKKCLIMSDNKIKEDIVKELQQTRNPHLPPEELKNIRVSPLILDTKSKHPFHLTPKASSELSTSRNRNLIYPDEQAKLRNTVVGFFGLSVGSHAAVTWMMESRADVIKIVDPDKISATNLNRIRVGWESVGRYKAVIIQKELQEINPYATVLSFTKVRESNIKKIFYTRPSLNVVVDEIDDIKGKLLLRKFAQYLRIPVISAIDVEDDIFVDIERYDINEHQKLFNNRLPDISEVNVSNLSEKEKKQLIIELVGIEKVSERMLNSVFGIGATIVNWPQLGATATIAGGVIASLIKKIILGENIKSGRYYLSLNNIFVSDFNSIRRVNERRKKIRAINKVLNQI